MRRIRIFFVRCYRILRDSIDAFYKNNDSLQASALTFYTLVAIVPFFAVAFGIASGFGFEEYLEAQIKRTFAEQQLAMGYIIQFAHALLTTSRSGLIAGIGFIALLWSNLSLFSSIENALNLIWKVRRPRSWGKKVTDYLAAMIICPIVFVVSSSLSVFLITQITQTAKENIIFEFVSPFLLLLLKSIPYVLSILLFIVLYLFVPNVKVRSRSRIFAGILAGLAFQFWQWIYIRFQVELSNYNIVYGTFAALPLFLIWLQVSWLIVLAGAEIAANIENEMAYIGYEKLREISQKEIALLIVSHCSRAYSDGKPPPTILELAQYMRVPMVVTQHTIDLLTKGGILVEVSMYDGVFVGYQPSRDAHFWTVRKVCETVEKGTQRFTEGESSPLLDKISECLKQINEAAEVSPANLNLTQIAEWEI